MVVDMGMQNPHLEGGSFLWTSGRTGVLLVHGYTATTAEVRLLAKVLHQNGYTVAGPLLPGHGTTPDEANKVHWQQWVGAVEASYRQLASRCDRVVIGGESMGGLIALYLASQHPEVAAVMVYAVALKTTSWTSSLAAGLLASFIPYQPKPPTAPSGADAYWQGYKANPIGAARELFRLQRQVRRRLKLIRRPLLVVQGRLDRSVHPDVPQILKDSVSSSICEVHWMEQSTHCVILDDERDQVAKITLDFLSRVLD